MLDAAHGVAARSVPPAQRIHAGRMETQKARTGTPDVKSRRRPYVALVTDAPQVSRRPVAAARSRRCVAIAIRNAAEREQNNSKCTIQNSELIEFSSKAQFHRCHSEAKPKNLLISNIHSSCARPGRLRGSHLRCEPAPWRKVKTLNLPFTHCSQTPQQTGVVNYSFLIPKLKSLESGFLFFEEIPPRCRSRREGGTKSVSAGAGLFTNPRTGARSSVSSSEAGKDNRKERLTMLRLFYSSLRGIVRKRSLHSLRASIFGPLFAGTFSISRGQSQTYLNFAEARKGA